MIQPFRKIRCKDGELQQVQDSAAFVFASLNREIIDGRLIEGIQIVEDPANPGTYLPATVDHKLGRTYKGWIITDINAGLPVWQYVPTHFFPEKSITFKSTGTVTFSIWIF